VILCCFFFFFPQLSTSYMLNKDEYIFVFALLHFNHITFLLDLAVKGSC